MNSKIKRKINSYSSVTFLKEEVRYLKNSSLFLNIFFKVSLKTRKDKK